MVKLLSQKEKQQWGTISTNEIGPWIWVNSSRLLIKGSIIFLPMPLRQHQLPHPFPDFRGQTWPRWSQGLLTSQLLCVNFKGLLTQLQAWARAGGQGPVWNAWAIPWEQQNGKGANKPARFLEGALSRTQQKLNLPKQTGSIKWAPGVWKLQT